MSNQSEPPPTPKCFTLTMARVGFILAIAALLVNAPRLVVVFLEADSLQLHPNVEGFLLTITGIATGVVLSGGGAYIAHKLGMIRNWNTRDPLHVALLVIWILMLLFSVVIIAPLMVQGVQESALKNVLHAPWQQWSWGIISVLAVEVLAAGAMIAAALEQQPDVTDRPPPAWQLALDAVKTDIAAALATLADRMASLSDTVTATSQVSTQNTEALNQQLTALTGNLTYLTETISDQQQVSAENTAALSGTIAILTDRIGTLGQLLTTNHKSTGQSLTTLTEGVHAINAALETLSSQLEAPKLTHVCPDCGKGFTSANGLGGHRSSCPMKKVNTLPLLNGHGGKHD